VRRKGEREEEERDRGQKRHFTAVLSPPKPEINILICLVSFSKFGTKLECSPANQSFSVSAGKATSLSVSASNFCHVFFLNLSMLEISSLRIII